MEYVILGAGPAGVMAAETLRGLDAESNVTLVGGEPEPPYSRMAIPYLLAGKIGEEGTYLRQAPGHYDNLAITYKQGRVGGLDTGKKQLFLSGGEELGYDSLLLATGASPIIPPMDGANLDGVHTCWTLEDARQIMAKVDKGTPIILVGAGFIGSIVLEALVARGADLTVVELADRMVARMMDETAGGMLKRWCEDKGVRVLTGTRVERITKAGGKTGGGGLRGWLTGRRTKADAEQGSGGLRVWLDDGAAIAAELVVMAVGVRPNVGFLVGSDVDINDGITVDQYMQTSAPGVYAAGDAAEAKDLSTGKPEVQAIQPTAVEHGVIAARNMAGYVTPHRGSLNMNVLDTLGLVSCSFGLWQGAPGGSTAKTSDESGYKYLHLEFDGDKLVGAQSVGQTDHIGVLRGLIQTGLPLGDWHDKLMKSPERLSEAYVSVAQGLPSHGWSGPGV